MRIHNNRDHPHLGATYRITKQARSFAVEVNIRDSFPATVSGFATRQDAEGWIQRHEAVIAEGFQRRSYIPRPGR